MEVKRREGRERGSAMCQHQGPMKVRARAWRGRRRDPICCCTESTVHKEPVRGTASGPQKTAGLLCPPCPTLTSLRKAPEGTGHLLVIENPKAALS